MLALDVQRGDVAIAIGSSGLHSNGYSLARHVAFDVLGMDVHDHVADFGRSLGEELLEPTRIYSRDLLELYRSCEVHSVSHITGGGIAANVARVLPDWAALDIARSSWVLTPVFTFLMAGGSIERLEAERTFNMGIGMVAFVAAGQERKAVDVLQSAGQSAWVLGAVRDRHADEVGDAAAKGGSGGAVFLVGDYRS